MTRPAIHPRDVSAFLRRAYDLPRRDADLMARQCLRSREAAVRFLPAPWVDALHPGEHERGRPAVEGGAAWTSKALDSASLPDPRDLLEGVFVLVVAYQVDGNVRYRRRVYMQLQTAQAAHARAVMRGQNASLTLCRLTPVYGLDGGTA